MGGQSDKGGVRSTPFKSRLCTRFMQKGECPYGPGCHFAHGYEDMQPQEGKSSAMEGLSYDMPFARPGMMAPEVSGYDMPFPRGGMMMPPGGPMMPAEYMAMAMGGMMPPRPRPPPGPPPGAPSGGGENPPFSPDRQGGFVFDVTRTPTRLPSDVPYLDRVKAACVLLGVGKVHARDAGMEAMEAAVASVQTGEAFESNVYADALHLLAH